MMTQTMRTTFRHVLVLTLLALFVLLSVHYSMAQEGTEIPSPEPTEEVAQENIENSENPTEENPEVLGEVLGEESQEDQTPSEIPPSEPEPEVEEIVEVEEVIPEPQPEPALAPIQKKPAPVVEEVVEEVPEEVVVPYIPPKNLPTIRAFPEVKEFRTDREAQHACWVSNFSLGMTFLPRAKNTLKINNPSPTPSEIEIFGVPTGFSVVFKDTNTNRIQLPSGVSELEIEIEKLNKPQRGNFNVVFAFTKTGRASSTATCQMNIVN